MEIVQKATLGHCRRWWHRTGILRYKWMVLTWRFFSAREKEGNSDYGESNAQFFKKI
jgi:hypothetical protein